MARTAFQTAVGLLVVMLLCTGCHWCRTDCEVTQVCYPEVKTEKIEKEGWDVECEPLCIPPIHCPLFPHREPKCGTVIAVKRLKADKLECGERCVVAYKLIDACPQPPASEEDEEEEPESLPDAPKPRSEPNHETR